MLASLQIHLQVPRQPVQLGSVGLARSLVVVVNSSVVVVEGSGVVVVVVEVVVVVVGF